MQRICISEDYRGTQPWHVREQWSFADALEAHMTLDALEEVRELYRPEPQPAARR